MNGEVKKNPDRSPLNNPWFQKAYDAAIAFHEKDEKLDREDRLDLYQKYKIIGRTQLFAGWLGFGAVFITPFAYRHYTTGVMKGIKVPRNFILGLIAMAFSGQLASNLMYKYQLNLLDYVPNVETSGDKYGDNLQQNQEELVAQEHKTRDQKVYEMMTLLKNGSASRWRSYFYVTYHDPSRKFPDPKVKMQQLKEFTNGLDSVSPFMHQRDPMGLYSKRFPKHKDKDPTGTVATLEQANPTNSNAQETQTRNSQSSWEHVRQQDTTPSSWDRVRRGETKDASDIPNFNDENDIFSPRSAEAAPLDSSIPLNHPTQNEFDKLLEEERNGGN
ncbi:Rci37p NDAI_0A02340 [Naumovozyma dairenensis CBS 421]|uniref:Uncharacterized protein n=1 Tax=Naumovozyma dairenensis (strain ATCC 10597 / BCRC 20456 / CBS 421 / NBRC 0211 / NRRL Y-12639) TaxID=1071378 RepID=G0W3K4_NAUDC|nr:hypothetical protein NDAI_0A02340 [Naumovozyma dairenensis CBS 421]CCD22392.1 hypothetical protein NDAI_0A02340 [Naumovozyma dairenensis CBS 421]